MIYIEVNTVRVMILTESEKNEHCPDEYVLRLYGGLYAHLQPTGISLPEALCVIAGHDWRKIDTAVPQAWFNDYCEKHGEKPRAWWSYEDDDAFGRPLLIAAVEHKAIDVIWGEFTKQVVEAK